MGMGVTGSPVPVHWVPTPSGPLAWGALPILPFNCTSKDTTKVELVSALVDDVNAVGDVVDGDVEDEGATLGGQRADDAERGSMVRAMQRVPTAGGNMSPLPPRRHPRKL